ncbi:coproporphyrinogen dehydrogenase HemZ [Sporanaerobacter sp. PP17-6a]|uniref:coproporphyrinogen dehydrogenase HemZ n=1 Tax=Sporanaerobacter sp. PP17-6a TaxID=1891289 RepID=UPI00089FB0A1|nr:coproporphyrinogen dehydrogenase HemZ [Sporanaerobacter sp. PP17-6a]SCL95685.1 Oxygen-independent coproporphyrinogen-III oxidase 2 [Sporanaerobacter sp. PP17-6a]
MVYIQLKGHDYRYEMYELIREFFFGEDIIFLDEDEEYKDKEIFIENLLTEKSNDWTVETKIYKDGILTTNVKDKSIQNLNIGRKSLNKKIKNGIKINLYESLTDFTGIKIPWGILTGVRPIKIVHDLMNKEAAQDEIFNVLVNGYKIDKEKAELIIRVAERQRKYIGDIKKDDFSLYISIPFCPGRCYYCSFPSNAIESNRCYVDEYTRKLIHEIESIGEIMKNRSIRTVYIGGGTPTAIPIKNLDEVIQCIYKTFNKDNIDEITVEAGRPDTMDRDMLSMLKKNRIDRISINPQTMNDRTLKALGRNHSSEDIKEVYYLAKEIGFDIINMDLIVGLPKEEINDVIHTLDEIKKLNPENLTVHTLAIKKGSKFIEHQDYFKKINREKIEKMIEISQEYAKEMNIKPYYLYRQKQMLGNFENTGYAKEGTECIYNIAIMEEKETIIGAGAGAVSKIYYPEDNKLERVPNVKDLREYLTRIDEMIERKSKVFLGDKKIENTKGID